MSTTTPRPLGRLTPDTTALLVCDVQERFRDVIWRFPAVIDTTARLVRGAAALGVPVFVTEQYPKALGATVPEVAAHLPGAAGGASTAATPIIAKTDFSMWSAYEAHTPPPARRHHLVLVGIEAHVCVLQTALDALAAGHEVHLAVDGISSQRGEPDRSTGLARALAAGAHAATSEQLLFQLCGGASHPAFKAVSGLAKEARTAPGLPGVGGGGGGGEARL
jgi:nicotinamidase-related amidase